MRTSYQLALNLITVGLGNTYVRETETNNQNSLVGVGDSISFFDLYNFSDKMHIDTELSRDYRQGFSYESSDERLLQILDFFPNLNDDAGISTVVGFNTITNQNIIGVTTTLNLSNSTVSSALENVTKAMLISVLGENSKRGYTVGIGTTQAKKEVFWNCLSVKQNRFDDILPWSNWNDSVGVCTPVSVARTDGVATVITSPAHGMSTSYDDWGVIMKINTGIATSFNISTSFYPNGVPIKIISPTSFTYLNPGINTETTNVSGTADIKVGWGGTSNNFHIRVT